jgi:hypothetical protein
MERFYFCPRLGTGVCENSAGGVRQPIFLGIYQLGQNLGRIDDNYGTGVPSDSSHAALFGQGLHFWFKVDSPPLYRMKVATRSEE